MHRMRIGLAAAGILLLATVGVFFAVTSDLRSAATRDVEEKVSRAQRLYHQISRLEGIDFANLAAERARKPSVVAVTAKTEETARRQAAFEECEVLNAALQKMSRKADILAILDASGKVLARDLNANAMYGDDLRAKYPAVARALKGEAVKDVWTLADRMTQVGLAPIVKPDGSVAGVLLIGFVLSAKQAQEKHDLLGAQIGYFHGGKMHASSFVAEGTGDNAKEDVTRTQLLNALLFQSPEKYADAALQKGAPTEIFRLTIEGRLYAGVAAPLPGNLADKTSGVVLLASITDGLDGIKATGIKVILFGVIAILVALGAAVMTAKRFLAPLDKIELGVAEIMNGNIDYTFKPVGPDFEGLSNSLNVMLARLLGREEPNEEAVEDEEAEERKWKAEQMLIDDSDGAANPQAAAALAGEHEAAYYPRLFNEYITALRQIGRPVDGVSVPLFTAKLRLAEAGLKEKWECRMVRFQVVTRGSDLVFRPVKIG